MGSEVDQARSQRSAEEMARQVEIRRAELADLDPEEFLKELRAGLERDQALELATLGQWEEQLDYDGVMTLLLDHFWKTSWTVALDQFDLIEPNMVLSSPLLGHLMEAISLEDPDFARDWLIENSEREGVLTGAWNVGKALMDKENPGKGFEQLWSLEMPDEVIRANFVSGYVEMWANRDLEGAFEHLSSLEEHPVLDRTFYDMIEHAVQINPEDALPWAEAIQDEGLRRSALIGVASEWLKRDREAYLQWAQNESPENVRDELPME